VSTVDALEKGTDLHTIIECLVREYVRKGPTAKNREQLILTVRSVLAFCVPVLTYQTAEDTVKELDKILTEQLDGKA
jgi:hypothetical protein